MFLKSKFIKGVLSRTPFFNRDKTKVEAVKFDLIVVGLGNPGSRYAGNRHNIGWMVVDALSQKYQGFFRRQKSLYESTAIKIKSKDVLLVKPMTYMNNSGEAVAALSKEFQVSLSDFVIVVDEYNFPIEKIHLKSGGSDGGHNGIMSIIEHLDSEDFMRLRCGIDKKFESGGMVDYVISDFFSEQIPARDASIIKAGEAIECLVRMGNDRAPSEINSGRLWKVPEKKKANKNIKKSPDADLAAKDDIRD